MEHRRDGAIARAAGTPPLLADECIFDAHDMLAVANAAAADAVSLKLVKHAGLLGMRKVDTAAVGFIAPALRAQLKLAPPQLVPLFGGGLFGLIAGAFIFGPIADAGTHDADC